MTKPPIRHAGLSRPEQPPEGYGWGWLALPVILICLLALVVVLAGHSRHRLSDAAGLAKRPLLTSTVGVSGPLRLEA
jgi:hypothetical protein